MTIVGMKRSTIDQEEPKTETDDGSADETDAADLEEPEAGKDE